MQTLTLILEGWLVLAIIMAILWVVQLWREDANIVDVGWTAGIGFLALYYALYTQGLFSRRMLVAALVMLWSYRLSSYLFRNRVLIAGEDGRYLALREKWGPRAQRNFFILFQAQALLAVTLSVPFLAVMRNSLPGFSVWEMLAMLVWAIAIAGEALADRQLNSFRSDPHNQGHVCKEGLWKYSRHPNYFFEWLHWWTYVLMGIGIAYGWVTIIGPLIMLYLFLKVTGVPPSEERAIKSRGEEYKKYQAATSTFFPWFPKKG